VNNLIMTPESLTRTMQEFLSEAASAVVLENGAITFDLAQSKYSISGEHNKCLVHFWSVERNAVRRVVDAEVKSGRLYLAVQRLGQTRPTKLEICRERDRRSPSSKRLARMAYEHKLRRALERQFPEFAIARLTTGAEEIVWTDLHAGDFAACAVRMGGTWGESKRNPGVDRCRTYLWDFVAGRVP
jgi:hypothetical protein